MKLAGIVPVVLLACTLAGCASQNSLYVVNSYQKKPVPECKYTTRMVGQRCQAITDRQAIRQLVMQMGRR